MHSLNIIIFMKRTLIFIKRTLISARRTLYFILSFIIAAAAFSGCAPPPDRTRASDTRFLLDTVCTVTVGGDDAEAVVSEVFDIISKIAAEIDYYDPGSSVSKFNSAPAGEAVPIGESCAEIVAAALDVSAASDGAFDITTAPLKDLWDFKSENPEVPAPEQLGEALAHVGYEKLAFDPDARTLSKTEDGVRIDLGGCGKGYCCQAAINYIEENRPDCFAIIDLGGNVGVYGDNPRTADGSFTGGIQNPDGEGGEYSQTVSIISGQSAVTSGTYQRHFVKDGVNYHHILDPATGMPASNGFESATIVCGSGVTADCLSTACMVLPEDEGRALAEKYGAELIYR